MIFFIIAICGKCKMLTSTHTKENAENYIIASKARPKSYAENALNA